MSYVVTVEPHRASWARDFAVEAEKIGVALGPVLRALHHIGSTAIPGIYAKPIIDILAEVTELKALDRRDDEMRALRYEAMGEFGIPGRRYFRKNDERNARTHQIHAFAVGSPHLERHLAFRDFLVAHPERARAYSDLKQRLVAACRGDLEAHVAGKDAFVKEAEREALRWAGGGD